MVPPFLSNSHLSPLLSVQYTPPIDTQACTLSVAQESSLTYSSTKHTHIHTYIHTCMHICIHAYIHTYIHAYMVAYIGIQRLHGWPYVLAICSVRLWHHFKCMTVLDRTVASLCILWGLSTSALDRKIVCVATCEWGLLTSNCRLSSFGVASQFIV